MNDDREPPLLLFLIGAPAVGKMTVGNELGRMTGLRLFHNHLSIEPALRFFDFGTPSFERLVGEFRRGGRVLFAELQASLEERLRRNEGESRLAEKPSKRNLDESRRLLLEHEARFQLRSESDHAREDWLTIDTTELEPQQVANKIVQHFALPRTQE